MEVSSASTEEMPEKEQVPHVIIQSSERNMIVDGEPVVIQNGDNIEIFTDYKKEMLQGGLQASDMEYFDTAYKNLEAVKFIRIHCTSCDKHIGSAPNDLQNRYEHPLLKVLICGDCFQFYSSGDFEKDEDGSELYCRWCGEGGQVFCCTKCPYVFCKKCIRLNLGRGIARSIQNSDNWMCFSCDPSQISRHRATYWAVQKYSEEMIKTSKITGITEKLAVDENICCSQIKKERKKSEVYSKLMQPPKKKPRLSEFSTKAKYYQSKKSTWQPSLISEQPEDEVICTPDIPMNLSPSHSPERVDSPVFPLQSPVPPMMPLVHHSVPTVAQVPPLRMRPPIPIPDSPALCMSDWQKQLQQKYTQIILTPRRQIKPPIGHNQAVLIRKPTPLLPKASSQNNGNYRLFMNPGPSNFLFTPINRPSNSVQNPVATTSVAQEKDKDWFEQAVVDCAEVTEYISTKISSLSGVHTRAYKSEKLMEELHNTFQTYMHIANEKINKIRRVMQNNFEKDMEKNFKDKRIVNPFAIKLNKPSNILANNLTSEDSNSRESLKNTKTKYILTKNVKPDEVLFDMDVTNASDEESSSRTTPVNEDNKNYAEDESDDDIQEIPYTRNTEIIHITDSEDEKEDNTASNIIPDELLEKIRAKFNIINIPSKELIKYLSAVILVTNKINKEIEELSNSKVSVITGELQRKVESKLMTGIQQLLEDSFNEYTNKNDEQTDNTINISLQKFDNSEYQKREQKHENEVTSDIEDKICDIEEILSSNVVVRANKSSTSFGDAFSKFVCEKVDIPVDMAKTDGSPTDIPDDLSNFDEFPSNAPDDVSKMEIDKPDEMIKITHEDVSKIIPETTYMDKSLSDVPDNVSTDIPEGRSNIKESLTDKSKNFATMNQSASITPDNMSKVEEFDDMSDSLKDSITIAKELEMIPEYVNDIYNNRDNGSLSLPPDNITGFTANEVEMLMQENIDDKVDECDVINKENNSDIVLNSEIMALKQLAENCVEHKTSTECQG